MEATYEKGPDMGNLRVGVGPMKRSMERFCVLRKGKVGKAELGQGSTKGYTARTKVHRPYNPIVEPHSSVLDSRVLYERAL